jgi:hypothetical protein
LAFIWSLRKLQGLKKIKVKEAYYLGNEALVPAIIVSVLLILTLIPALIGSSVLSVTLHSASGSVEIAVVSLIALIFLFISLYLFVMFWPAFYIVTLPKTFPLEALKSAVRVTKKRRLILIRNMFLWFMFLFFVMFAILLLSALLWEALVPIVAFVLLFVSFGLSHVYLYMLYRELL